MSRLTPTGARPAGSRGRVLPDTRRMTPEEAKAALEKSLRDLDRDIKELSGGAVASGAASDAAIAALAARVTELEGSAPRVLASVALGNGTEETIAHTLDASPSFISVSPPKGTAASSGRVVYLSSADAGAPYDESVYIVLRADGWGGGIVVDVMVIP